METNAVAVAATRAVAKVNPMPPSDLKPNESSNLRYATEGQVVGDIPLQNTLEGPQYHPQPHPLHSTAIKNPHAMAEMGKVDHLKERLRAIEGGKDYAFANLEKLFLVPKHGHSQVQGVGLWQVQGEYLP